MLELLNADVHNTAKKIQQMGCHVVAETIYAL